MTTSDGFIIGTIKLIDHGPAVPRWNLVVLGDGYQQDQITKYQKDAQAFVDHLSHTAPFDELWDAVNIYRVDVASTDNGADDPTACGGSGLAAHTYFDASFCNYGIRRLLLCNSATALSVSSAQVPEVHNAIVIVNSLVYGGSGGSVATFSMAQGADEIGIHELGHTAFGFADEYEYYSGCYSGETGQDMYSGNEPVQPNVTAQTNRAAIKWQNLIAAATPMPSTKNTDCTRCDSQASPLPDGTVGAFEGAYYHHCGAHRPEFNCRMRALNYPFCAVCQQTIRQTLAPFLPSKQV